MGSSTGPQRAWHPCARDTDTVLGHSQISKGLLPCGWSKQLLPFTLGCCPEPFPSLAPGGAATCLRCCPDPFPNLAPAGAATCPCCPEWFLSLALTGVATCPHFPRSFPFLGSCPRKPVSPPSPALVVVSHPNGSPSPTVCTRGAVPAQRVLGFRVSGRGVAWEQQAGQVELRGSSAQWLSRTYQLQGSPWPGMEWIWLVPHPAW